MDVSVALFITRKLGRILQLMMGETGVHPNNRTLLLRKNNQAMKSEHVSAYFKVRKDTMKGYILCGSDYIVCYEGQNNEDSKNIQPL